MDEFNINNFDNQSIKDMNLKHGGNILEHAKKLNLSPSQIID